EDHRIKFPPKPQNKTHTYTDQTKYIDPSARRWEKVDACGDRARPRCCAESSRTGCIHHCVDVALHVASFRLERAAGACVWEMPQQARRRCACAANDRKRSTGLRGSLPTHSRLR